MGIVLQCFKWAFYFFTFVLCFFFFFFLLLRTACNLSINWVCVCRGWVRKPWLLQRLTQSSEPLTGSAIHSKIYGVETLAAKGLTKLTVYVKNLWFALCSVRKLNIESLKIDVSSLCTVLSKYIYLLVYSEEKKVSISTCKTADDKRTLISMFYPSFVVQLIKLLILATYKTMLSKREKPVA